MSQGSEEGFERDGVVARTVHERVPPRVDYANAAGASNTLTWTRAVFKPH